MRSERPRVLPITAVLVSGLTLVSTVALSLAGTTPAQATRPAAQPSVHEGDLRIANHSFENGTTSWIATNGRGEPASENCRDNPATSTSWSSDGEQALLLPGKPPCVAAGAASEPVAAEAGETYTAFAHVRAEARPRIGLRWLDDDGQLLDSTFTRPRATSGPIEVRGTAPEGATQVTVELGARGEAQFDQVLVTAPLTALGNQVTKRASYLSMATGVDENGRHVTYSMATGSEVDPAILTVTDILTGEVVRNVRLPGATGSWSVRQNPVTETVYIGSYGEPALWLYTPGDTEATEVGPPPIEHWGFMYDVAFDEEGTAYGGGWGEPTDGFAGATLYKFREGEGYQGTLGPNPLVTDAAYSRPVAYEEQTDTVFTGTGTNAHLIACSTVGEPRCTDLIDLFSPRLQEATWVYGLTAGNGYVMAWTGEGNSDGTDALVVLKVSRNDAGELAAEVVKEIEGVVYNGSSPVVDDKIYYTKANEQGSPLHSFDVVTGEETTMPSSETGIFSRRWEAVRLGDPQWPGTTIVGWDSGGTLVKYNVEKEHLERTEVADVPDVSLRLNSVTDGPDGDIWSAGYLTGGLGVEEPMRDDRQRTFAVGGQAEHMVEYRGRIYQGRYPTATIESFTPQQVRAGKGPRVDCAIGAQQNRPYGLFGHKDRIYYGSQAEYGHDKGAFGWLDLNSGECTTLRDVIGHQSINTIAASGDKVFGGGSIFYGYDGTPIEEQAKLLILDEKTDRTSVIEWPVPDTRAVNASATATDGTVWFYAEGWLLAMDPETERWVHREHIFPDWKPGARIGGAYARMTVNTDGRIYGNADGRVFGFDPGRALEDGSAEGDLRILFEGAGLHIANDAYGNIYVPYATTRLLRIDPE